MLNADVPVPKVVAQRAPTYGQIFHKLIATTASRVSPGIAIKSRDFDVRKEEYPESLSDVDMILISGSTSSAYDDVRWIRTLGQYILDVYINYPHVKIFGSCFGHQIVCQSLLRDIGVRVEPDVNGWELGVQEITLEKRFCEAIGEQASSSEKCDSTDETDKMRLQFVHGDHVVIPSLEALPDSWMTLGHTQHCAVQGVYEKGRIFTLQGHFEFDRFINSETVKTFFASWDPTRLNLALAAIDSEDDSEKAIELLLKFMQEDGPSRPVTP